VLEAAVNLLVNGTGLDTRYEEMTASPIKQALATVDTTRPQRKRATKEYLERKRDLEKEMWTAGHKYSCRKMEVAAQDRAGWRQVVCGLCSTGSDKAYVKVSRLNFYGFTTFWLLFSSYFTTMHKQRQ